MIFKGFRRARAAAAALVMLAATVHAGQVPDGFSPVKFYSDDGILLSGRYHAPARRKNPVLILQHGLGSTQGEWDGFARQLAAAGYGVLSFDLRGHGESKSTRSGGSVSYQDFGQPGSRMSWSRAVGDLDAAVRFLNREKRIRTRRVGLAGASLGANISFLYAASRGEVPFAVLLSPGINYAGLSSLNAVDGYGGRPLLVVAANGDSYAYRTSEVLYQRMHGKGLEFLDGGSGHGVEMLKDGVDGRIIEWIRAHAPESE